jgi:hypothetical protein
MKKIIFVLRLRPRKGANPILALRKALKYLGRYCGLQALSVEEEKPRGSSDE